MDRVAREAEAPITLRAGSTDVEVRVVGGVRRHRQVHPRDLAAPSRTGARVAHEDSHDENGSWWATEKGPDGIDYLAYDCPANDVALSFT